MRNSWTDERLDDLNGRVGELSKRVDTGFARIDTRLDGMQRTMLIGVIALVSAILAGFGATIALVASQI